MMRRNNWRLVFIRRHTQFKSIEKYNEAVEHNKEYFEELTIASTNWSENVCARLDGFSNLVALSVDSPTEEGNSMDIVMILRQLPHLKRAT